MFYITDTNRIFDNEKETLVESNDKLYKDSDESGDCYGVVKEKVETLIDTLKPGDFIYAGVEDEYKNVFLNEDMINMLKYSNEEEIIYEIWKKVGEDKFVRAWKRG